MYGVTYLGIVEAEMGVELVKFVMMKSFFKINFLGFTHILFYSKLILKLL